MGKKYGLVTGTVQNVGIFSGILQNLLGSNPQTFRHRIAGGTDSLTPNVQDYPGNGHHFFMAKTVKRLWKRTFFVKKKQSWTDILLSMCVLKKSLGHTRHRPTRWFFVERKHQISRANPTPTWRPRASASSQDWWPINGAPFPGQESLISAPFSSDFMAKTQGISMSGIQKRLWTLVNWQSKHAIFVVRNGKKSGTQTGRNDDVFFSSIPSSWLECRLLSQ